jgi:glutathione reductase (NADPH)
MAEYDFDLFVIGGGSGGVSASRRAAAHGARVALCEADAMGGTCVMRGCVPKKLLATAASYRDHFADARAFGYGVAEPAFSWPALMAMKDREIARLSAVYRGLLVDGNVHVLQGRAHLRDAHTVCVAERDYRARHILIATGSRPALPPIPGVGHGISSDAALELAELPRRLTIVGGGYIGVEMASIFHTLGAQVTLLAREQQVLPGFDGDIRRALGSAMQKRGVTVQFGTNVQSLERTGGSLSLQLASGERNEADVVLWAVGRVPNTQGLQLAELGVELSARGAVKVDANSRSSLPSVHAVGDCTDRLNLTPVAIAEGRALADTLFGSEPAALDYQTIPTAVFCEPQLASAGLSEDRALAAGRKVRRYLKSFLPLKHGLTGRDARTLMKVVVDAQDERVLGIHMLGSDAAEIIQGFAVALRLGLTKAQLDACVGLHPTAAEELVSMRREHCGPFEF